MTGIEFNETREDGLEASTNYEDGESYDPDSPELRLVKNVVANLLEDSFYESAQEKFDDVFDAFDAVASTNPEFVLKTAAYVRQEENLRQVPQLLLVLAANDDRTKQYVREYAPAIMSRADEPLDALGLHVERHGTSIPNPLQKGIEDALHQFNSYQFAKWDRPSREWQYWDLMNLVHPRPRDDERDAIFEQIVLGELDSHDEIAPLRQEGTWESAQSAAGKEDSTNSADVWRQQLVEGDDGYSMPIFARVRNVRNMLQDGLTGEEIFGDECGPVVDDDWIRNSKLYPFRYYQAYKAIRDARVSDRYALEWLEDAMKVSTENLPDTFDNTLAVVDTSGSMTWGTISEQSSLYPVEIGALFGALMVERGCDAGAFASSFEMLNLDPRDTIMTNANKLRDAGPGGATHGHKVPKALARSATQYDQVIMFTDEQMWGGSFRDEWNIYKELFPEASLYMVDLASYGDLTIPEGADDVYNINGWSESVIDFINSMENTDGMVREIESYEP